MKALVFLSAVVAAAMARPGSLVAVQSPAPDDASSKVPTARTNGSLEASVDGISQAQISSSIQNPELDSSETSRPINPILADDDGSDDPTGIRFVDNPHIGLPFGTMLSSPVQVSFSRVSPTDNTERTLDSFRIDSPHAGLPPFTPTLDSPYGISISNSEKSRLLNPTIAESLSDNSDGPSGIRFVDNPHIGLPFGTVLPLAVRMSSFRVSPTTNTEETFNFFRIDSPHVGLPPIIPTLDSPTSNPTVSSATSISQSGTSSDGAFGYSNILSGRPSKGDGVRNQPSNTSPASLTVNRDAINFGNRPKSQFSNCVIPGFLEVFIHNSLPDRSYLVFYPVSSPIPHVPSNAGLPIRIDSASLQINNGNSHFLISNPDGGFLTKTFNSKFPNSPSSIFTPTGSPNKFLRSFPVNSATSNPQSQIPINTDSFGFPKSSPNYYPLTNTDFTNRNPSHSLPINIPASQTSPSTNLLVNSDNVLLFSEKVPHGNVVNTAQGPVLVGGPFNLAVFPNQPSMDDINQVLAAHTSPPSPSDPAAWGPDPAFSHAFRPAADTAE